MIFPDGVCTASLAGFIPWLLLEPLDEFDGCEKFEPEAEMDCIDIAEAGRAKGLGDARPFIAALGSGVRFKELGCWRTVNTKVLFRAKFAHCGCAT